MKTLTISILMILISGDNTYSQWSNDPNLNLQVCGAAGEQALPKVANANNNGTYISWFDNRNGSYAVYLIRLSALGIIMMSETLISNNPQSTSLVDYDMISDDSGNAIIAFTDTRNGSNINPFVYKISPQGNFLWGANGITLANDVNTFQPNPKLAKTTDNSIVVTWVYSSTPNKIVFQKISPGGVKQWGADPVYLSGTGAENFTFPSLVTSDNNSVIALWSGYTGSFLNPGNYKLYSQKFSSDGSMVWKDTVYSLGRVTGFFTPKIFPDESNGALYVWEDDRNAVNLRSAFVQHYSSSGTRIFPLNGAEVSTESGVNKFDAWASYMTSTNETYLVWKNSNSLQSQFAIYGQRLSSDGGRLWGDNGKEFVPFSSNSYINQVCFTFDTNIVYAFNEAIFGSINNLQKSFTTNRNGILGWTGSVIDVSSVSSEKSKVVATLSNTGMTKIVWSDGRNGASDIYAQNVNSNGTLGNTGVFISSNTDPVKYSLSQNYPNPFNPVTVIRYSLNESRSVTLKVFDAPGKEIATLVCQKQSAGSYEVTFDGSKLASGLYFYTLAAGDFSETRSMLLVK